MPQAQDSAGWEGRSLRSFLFAPGNHPRRLEKVGTFNSDAIVLDLEDAVADAEKEAARETVRAALPTYTSGAIVLVRVNASHTGRMEEDVEAVACAELDGIMVPKVEESSTLPELDRRLVELERNRGLDEGAIRLIPLIETALGLVRCEEIALAAPPRVVTLAFGIGDFSLDIGVDLTADATELLYARSRIVVAARAARLEAPIDGPYLDLQNTEGLIANTRQSRQLGFQGRVVVYPPQVGPVQRAYSELSPDEVARVRRVVTAFEESEAAGLSAIQVDGRFIDYPVYYRARNQLQAHETLTSEKLT